MAKIIGIKDIKKLNIDNPYIRFINFYLLVITVALFLRWAGLRSLILSCLFSYCALKYVFSILRKVDAHFNTSMTSAIEDQVFLEGSFIADLQSAIDIIATLLLPHFSKILNLSFSDIIDGIVKSVQNQKPIDYHGELVNLDSPIVQEIRHYSKYIVGSYGKIVNMKQEKNISSDVLSKFELNDVSSLFEIQLGNEAYVEFLLQHSEISIDDLLYCCFEGDPLTTSNGTIIHSPPIFILRDQANKSVVLLIRGTQNINDVLTDIYGANMKWEEGTVHEGIGLIAKWIATDNLIFSTLDDALNNNPDYALRIVGHSLGASIAALVAIHMVNHKTFKKHEKRTKSRNFLRCFAYAPPPMMSKEIKEKGTDFVYTIINEDDIVPRLNVSCIYGVLQDIEKYAKENKEVTEKEEVVGAIQAFQQSRLRNSLQHMAGMKSSHLNESTNDTECCDADNNTSFKLKSKLSVSNGIQSFIHKMKEYEKKRSERKKNKHSKNDTSFGDFVLPGVIYLLHPYIANGDSYIRYEETKSKLATSFKAIGLFLSSSTIPKAPGIMQFSSEELFPQVMRLSPFLTTHHNYRTYEESIENILRK